MIRPSLRVFAGSIFVAASLFVGGCASPERKEAEATQQAVAAVGAILSPARQGLISWEQAYTNLYNAAPLLGDATTQNGILAAANALIPYARQFDRREISAETFSDVQRKAEVYVRIWVQDQRQKAASTRAQQSAAESAALQNALAGLAMSQAVQQPAFRAPVNCTSSQLGTFVNTTCR